MRYILKGNSTLSEGGPRRVLCMDKRDTEKDSRMATGPGDARGMAEKPVMEEED